MEEEWKVIEEFPSYMVSSLGRIKNINTNYILVGGYDRDGYKQVTLCKNKKQYNRRICRMVALAFIPNPDNLPQVNHKDENRENDNVTNLEWCTSLYNNTYGTKLKKSRKRVKCIETNTIYEGLRVAERELNIAHSNIAKACNEKGTAGGFHWEFAD